MEDAAILENRYIAISTQQFHECWRNSAQRHTLAPYRDQTVKKFEFLKSKMAAAAILKITKIAISHQRIDQSLRHLAWWCKMGLLTIQTVKNLNISKIQDGGRPPFWKPLNRHISALFDRFWWNLARWCGTISWSFISLVLLALTEITPSFANQLNFFSAYSTFTNNCFPPLKAPCRL